MDAREWTRIRLSRKCIGAFARICGHESFAYNLRMLLLVGQDTNSRYPCAFPFCFTLRFVQPSSFVGHRRNVEPPSGTKRRQSAAKGSKGARNKSASKKDAFFEGRERERESARRGMIHFRLFPRTRRYETVSRERNRDS